MIALYILAALAFLIVIFYYGTKLLDWYEDRKRKQYADTLAEFVADCTKLHMKYIKRGEYIYAESLKICIERFFQPEPEPQPRTNYGEQIRQQLTEDEGR